MPEPLIAVVIPFRDRGIDPLRGINLGCVVSHWEGEHGIDPLVSTDGRGGKQQFNRSAAYNRGIKMQKAIFTPDVWVFAESDMLVSPDQVDDAIDLALEHPGLVVPFTQYCALRPEDSHEVVTGRAEPYGLDPEFTIPGGRSKGAINILSSKTLDMVGRYDEKFEGNWYDDNAMTIAFEICSGHPARNVDGPAYHLWHLPGHRGSHLTPEDKRATLRNKHRLGHYEFAARTNNVARIRQLVGGS
jgi:hypothetical protein